MLFRLALLEGGAEERLSAGFGRRQPAAASLSAAGPVPESGASSQKRQAAGRQNAAFGQILGLRPPGSLVPPAAGPPCRQGNPEEPLRATTGKVRGAAKNFSQGRSFPFLSTLPARGATCYSWRSRYRRWYFYPRSPQGERQRTFPSLPISPLFLSTLPAKGSDPSATGAAPGWPYFYPHSPQGERRQNPTNIKDGFCAKVPNKNLKYTKQNAILCIQHNFNIDGRGLQGGVRCESSGQTMCAGTSRGQCAAAHNRTSL